MPGLGQVTELWRHIRYSLRPNFQRNGVCGNLICRRCGRNGDVMQDLDQNSYGHTWSLTLHFGLQKFIREHWPWLTTFLPTVAKLVLGAGVRFFNPETEYTVHFSRNSHLPRPMTIIAIDLVCPQAIFLVSVALFPYGLLCVANTFDLDAVTKNIILFGIERKTCRCKFMSLWCMLGM